MIMANGGYSVMDCLAQLHGGTTAPTFSFPEIDLSGLARAFGCPARRVGSPDELEDVFDEILPDLAARDEPLFLEVTVAPVEDFVP